MKAVSLTKKKISVLATVIFTLLLVSSLFSPILPYQSEHVVSAKDKNIVLGYYTSWNPPKNLDPNKVTHINYSFADVCWDGSHGNPDNDEIEAGKPKTWPCRDLKGNVKEDIPNGTIVLYDYEIDLKELPKLAAMKNQNKDLKTLVSVGGWTLSNNLSLVARTEETREAFAQSAVNLMREFNLDGIDIDWEYPVAAGMPNNHRDPSDKQNHTLLLQAVRDAFTEAGNEDGKQYLVTIAGAANWAYADNNELGKIADIVDYVAIMAYDINGTWAGLTGHNAPLHFDPLEAQVRGWNFGVDGTLGIYSAVPKNKLLLGVPFYGHSWAGCNADNEGKMLAENGPYQHCAAGWEKPGYGGGTVGYDVVKSLVNQDGYLYYFDNVSKVPYLYNEQKGEFISYDNVESLGYKVNFIKEKGLAGAMIWDLSTDDEDYNLLKTVSSGLGISNEAPSPDTIADIEIEVSGVPFPVNGGSTVKITNNGEFTGVELQLPSDLPVGTRLSIADAKEGMDKLTGLKPAGAVYTFTFEYPNGEDFTSEEGFVLTLSVNEGAENPAVYYYNSGNGKWEKVGGDVGKGNITVTVNHFSTYGVFVEEKVVEPVQPPKEDDSKNPEDPGKVDDPGKDKDPKPEDSGKPKDPGKGNNSGGGSKNEGKKPNAGKPLPNTATNLYNILGVGIIAILAGVSIFIYQRRKELAKK